MCACVYLAILGGALFISWLPCISVKSSLRRDLIKRDLTIVKLNWGWCLDSHWSSYLLSVCLSICSNQGDIFTRSRLKVSINLPTCKRARPPIWSQDQTQLQIQPQLLARRPKSPTTKRVFRRTRTNCLFWPATEKTGCSQLFRSSLNFRVSWYLCAWNSDICRGWPGWYFRVFVIFEQWHLWDRGWWGGSGLTAKS